MKRKILTAAMIAPMLAVSASAATHECFVPMKDWRNRVEVIRYAEAQGWVVQRVRIDDGCYELFAVSSEGFDIEVRINPASLEILSIEIERFRSGEEEQNTD